MPPLRLSFVFSSHGPLPAVVQAHLSHGLLALTSLLLEIRKDFLIRVVVCSQNWVFDLTKKNAHFSSLALLTNTQNPEKYL